MPVTRTEIARVPLTYIEGAGREHVAVSTGLLEGLMAAYRTRGGVDDRYVSIVRETMHDEGDSNAAIAFHRKDEYTDFVRALISAGISLYGGKWTAELHGTAE